MPCTTCDINEFEVVPCSSTSDRICASPPKTSCVCKRGFEGLSASQCTECEIGYFKNNTGFGNCAACAAGHYNQINASFSCDPCPQHTYQNETAGSTCYDCPRGWTSDAGSTNCSFSPATQSAQCRCRRGYTGPDGEACTLCPQGTYKAEIGSTPCLQCPNSVFSPAGSVSVSQCTGCLTGYFLNTTDNQCIQCPVNTTTVGNAQSIEDCLCEPGTTGHDGGPCLGCVSGTYKTSIGSSYCSLCPLDTYSETLAAKTPDVCLMCQY